MKKKIIAIIPARGNSKRLKNKNMLKLNGKPLIYHTIKAAKKSKFISDVFVSTECKNIKSYAQSLGIKVIDRPKILSRDTSQNNNVILHSINFLEKTNRIIDIIILLQVTSPLRDERHIDESLKLFLKNEKYNSCISGCEVKSHPAKMIKLSNNEIKPYKTKIEFDARSQNLEKIYQQNGAIYIAKRDKFVRNKTFYSKPCLLYKMDQKCSIDVDDELDLIFAKSIFRNKL